MASYNQQRTDVNAFEGAFLMAVGASLIVVGFIGFIAGVWN